MDNNFGQNQGNGYGQNNGAQQNGYDPRFAQQGQQDPMYTQQNGYDPRYAQQGQQNFGGFYVHPLAGIMEQIKAHGDSAFGKALASVILSDIPLGSIIAIILAAVAKGGAKKAEGLASSYGLPAGGKVTAAKILSTIGLILGIVCTVAYAVSFITGLLGGLMYDIDIGSGYL